MTMQHDQRKRETLWEEKLQRKFCSEKGLSDDPPRYTRLVSCSTMDDR